jgi:hypothetical protein
VSKLSTRNFSVKRVHFAAWVAGILGVVGCLLLIPVWWHLWTNGTPSHKWVAGVGFGLFAVALVSAVLAIVASGTDR